MIFDPLHLILAIPGFLLGIIAQIKLSGTYHRYIQVPAERGLTGAQAAREILDQAGLEEMPVQEVAGHLTDHYDPVKRALFLSSENYRGRSLAAVGVAAHEAGHALQHQTGYTLLRFRMLLVPATNFATNASFLLVILGQTLSMTGFAMMGLILYGIITLFHAVTLPVEFNASNRAKQQLLRLGIVHEREASGVSKVLNAAALTYVAALVTAALTLLYFFLRARNSRD